jgi:hypothetical protein
MLDASKGAKKRASRAANAEGSRCSARSFSIWPIESTLAEESKGGEHKGEDAKVASKSMRGRTFMIARHGRESGAENPKVRIYRKGRTGRK